MSVRLPKIVAIAVSLMLLSGFGHAAFGGPSETFRLGVGKQAIEVEIAATHEARSRGLMFRRALAPGTGMLFVFPRPRRLSFWMRNTAIPLDIGFFDGAGLLREIHSLQPFDETPVSSHGANLQFALEVNRGWFAAHGIDRGARLDLEALEEILAPPVPAD